jgi:hypothetical protein
MPAVDGPKLRILFQGGGAGGYPGRRFGHRTAGFPAVQVSEFR